MYHYPMEDMHLKHKKYLMSKSEHSLYQTLLEILGNDYYVFSQVHIGTITQPNARKSKSGAWSWWDRVRKVSDQYSVDFVVCEKEYTKPLLVIELDGSSHTIPKRIKRDQTVGRWLKEAELDVLRISTDDAVNDEFVLRQLQKHLAF